MQRVLVESRYSDGSSSEGWSRRRLTPSIGGMALNQIGQLSFDRAFIGMNGVDLESYSTRDLEEGAVKRAILEECKEYLHSPGLIKTCGGHLL